MKHYKPKQIDGEPHVVAVNPFKYTEICLIISQCYCLACSFKTDNPPIPYIGPEHDPERVLSEEELEFGWQIYNHIEKTWDDISDYAANDFKAELAEVNLRRVATLKAKVEAEEEFPGVCKKCDGTGIVFERPDIKGSPVMDCPACYGAGIDPIIETPSSKAEDQPVQHEAEEYARHIHRHDMANENIDTLLYETKMHYLNGAAGNKYYPGCSYQKLFDHLIDEHGLTLVDSEMDEIIRLCSTITPQEGERELWTEVLYRLHYDKECHTTSRNTAISEFLTKYKIERR